MNRRADDAEGGFLDGFAVGGVAVEGSRHVFGGAGEFHRHDTFVDHGAGVGARSEEHTSELQSHVNLVCRLLLEKKKTYGSILVLRWLNGRCGGMHPLPALIFSAILAPQIRPSLNDRAGFIEWAGMVAALGWIRD